MSKIDLLIIKILLKICDILSYNSEKISPLDLCAIKQEIEELND